jgi:hypothetical protein
VCIQANKQPVPVMGDKCDLTSSIPTENLLGDAADQERREEIPKELELQKRERSNKHVYPDSRVGVINTDGT